MIVRIPTGQFFYSSWLFTWNRITKKQIHYGFNSRTEHCVAQLGKDFFFFAAYVILLLFNRCRFSFLLRLIPQPHFPSQPQGFGNVVCRTFSSRLDTVGSHQFSDDKLKAAVSEGTYAAFRESNRGGASLGKAERNEIANAMANFAIGLGATNFCHKCVMRECLCVRFACIDKG